MLTMFLPTFSGLPAFRTAVGPYSLATSVHPTRSAGRSPETVVEPHVADAGSGVGAAVVSSGAEVDFDASVDVGADGGAGVGSGYGVHSDVASSGSDAGVELSS